MRKEYQPTRIQLHKNATTQECHPTRTSPLPPTEKNHKERHLAEKQDKENHPKAKNPASALKTQAFLQIQVSKRIKNPPTLSQI